MTKKLLVDTINDNKRLICSIINKYTKYYEFEDLYQVGVIGIIKAFDNYNPDSSAKFSTYAYKYILSEVISFVNNSKIIKTSREYNQLYKKILETKTLLTQRLMKEPSNYELSLFLELDEKVINDVLMLKESVKSLDEAITEDGNNLTLLDSLYLANDNINTDNIMLNELLQTLTEEELKLINLRYFQDKTQAEIAKYFNTNQVQISRNETKILKKLKKTACKTA
jgi:RNA polymerase sporulation-specific sigma factor